MRMWVYPSVFVSYHVHITYHFESIGFSGKKTELSDFRSGQ